MEKEFAMILLIVFCSLWLGAMIFVLEELKNLLVIFGQINPEEIISYAPLISSKINATVLWDLALLTILVVYLVSLVSVFYYTKSRMSKGDGER